MRIVAIDPVNPRADRVVEAAERLRDGGVVALPTETFYGLASDALNPTAVARLNPLKQKSIEEPVLLLLANRGQISQVAADVPDVFDRLAERFWPGPLTLVVKAHASLSIEITGGRGTVAVRVPGLALPRRLATELGRPITGVSANIHRQPGTRTAADVVRSFPSGLDLILDGGTTAAGTASTIVILTGDRPVLKRRGLIPAASLEPFLDGLVLGDS